MKLPWFHFFTGDWLKDPALSLCSPATRGVWIDLICAMHELGRVGELRGTTEQLARLARCQPAELESALTELQTTGAADVTERNKIVTVENRRMKKEHNERNGNALRQERFRAKRASNAPVTAQKSEVRVQNTEESSLTLALAREGEAPPTPPPTAPPPPLPEASIPTLTEIKAYGSFHGVPPELCQSFFDHYEGNNLWRNQHGILINWKHKLSSWRKKDQENAANNQKPSGNSSQRPDRNAGTYNKAEGQYSKLVR